MPTYFGPMPHEQRTASIRAMREIHAELVDNWLMLREPYRIQFYTQMNTLSEIGCYYCEHIHSTEGHDVRDQCECACQNCGSNLCCGCNIDYDTDDDLDEYDADDYTDDSY